MLISNEIRNVSFLENFAYVLNNDPSWHFHEISTQAVPLLLKFFHNFIILESLDSAVNLVVGLSMLSRLVISQDTFQSYYHRNVSLKQ